MKPPEPPIAWAIIPIESAPPVTTLPSWLIADVSAGRADGLQQHAVRAAPWVCTEPVEVEGDRPGDVAIANAGEIAVGITAAAADRLGDDPGRAVAMRVDVAVLRVTDRAGGIADRLQQQPVRSVALVSTVPVRSKAIAPESPVPSALPKAPSTTPPPPPSVWTMMPMLSLPRQDIAGLVVVHVAGIAAADGLEQDAVGAVAVGVDRADEAEVDGARGAGAGIADEVAVDIAARAADGLGDDPDRIIALGDDVAGLAVADVAGGGADGLQQRAVRAVAAGLDRCRSGRTRSAPPCRRRQSPLNSPST